ncbi:MAG: putative RNA methyltransferase [Candidatus Neomarinimicrobiota bacterium]|nr:MAG: putative RNA methyltransferase [Candidatus Neomarinimicrobiota bacterium]
MVYKKHRGYAEARPLEILRDSPHVVDSLCRHFPICGGCSTQNLDYKEQVNQKKKQVEDLYIRQAGIDDFSVNKVIVAEKNYNYRNKMEFSFSNRRWLLEGEKEVPESDFALGLHIPRRYDKILDIKECHIQEKICNNILNLVRTEALNNNLKPYDNKTNNGYLRHLVLRYGYNTGELMVNLVTSYENTKLLEPIIKALLNQFPDITSIVNNINTRRADVAYGESEIIPHGAPAIREKLDDITFEISANSFFQTNTEQAEKLFQVVLDNAGLTGKEIVFDLFCGTGSIALFLARFAKKIYGFDVIKSAIEDATRNAVVNGIDNTKFQKVNLETYFKKGRNLDNYPTPDLLKLDPPRSGIHKNLVKSLPKFGSRQKVYVS